MAIYKVIIHYDAYAERDVEAESKEEAADIALDNISQLRFNNGEYEISEIEKFEDEEDLEDVDNEET